MLWVKYYRKINQLLGICCKFICLHFANGKRCNGFQFFMHEFLSHVLEYYMNTRTTPKVTPTWLKHWNRLENNCFYNNLAHIGFSWFNIHIRSLECQQCYDNRTLQASSRSAWVLDQCLNTVTWSTWSVSQHGQLESTLSVPQHGHLECWIN